MIGVASIEVAIPPPYDYTFRGSVVGVDAKEGALRWRVYLTGDGETGGAGVSIWSSAAVDTARKLVFIGTGNSYEEPAGPLSDSLVAIDYEAGELVWHRQFTRGDVYTRFQPPPRGEDARVGAAPNLFRIAERDVVGVGDKNGVYTVLDRDTGEVLWGRLLTEELTSAGS